ncbi:MAG: DUF4118 domain-containing protein [Bacteroidetes bacterium]|nr:DUF4118 domain-containing protein [Bacteroidota bacterium]
MKIREYLISFLAIVCVGAICFLFSDTIGYQTVGLVFLIIVAALSLFLGRGPVIFAAFLNFGIWNYFFIPPRFTFQIHNYYDIITLFANFLVAIVGGTLINRIRSNQDMLRKSREDISILFSFLESLNNANSIKDVVNKTREELAKHFHADAIIYLREKEGLGLARKAFGNLELFNEEEYEAALRIFTGNTNPGMRKEFPDPGKQAYFPLIVPRGTIGVIGIIIKDCKAFTEAEMTLLNSFLAQISSTLDREINIDIAKKKLIYSESEKLFQTVLNSVSHELRTPIAIISAAVSNLTDAQTSGNEDIRRQICEELQTASNRLNLLVENLLDISRIESGKLKLHFQDCDISDLVGIALNEMKSELANYEVLVTVQENLPAIRADINLLKQALINVIYNSTIYSPAGGKIMIDCRLNNGKIEISITDSGKGVPEPFLENIFDKFYRVPGSKSGGTGLGLTITRAITEAHHGTVSASNGKEGGLEICITFNPE